jgi:hypothetical protein
VGVGAEEGVGRDAGSGSESCTGAMFSGSSAGAESGSDMVSAACEVCQCNVCLPACQHGASVAQTTDMPACQHETSVLAAAAE